MKNSPRCFGLSERGLACKFYILVLRVGRTNIHQGNAVTLRFYVVVAFEYIHQRKNLLFTTYYDHESSNVASNLVIAVFSLGANKATYSI